MTLESLALKMKSIRYKRYYSILDVAKRSKVSRSTIIAFENCKTDIKLSTLFKLCDALRINIMIAEI